MQDTVNSYEDFYQKWANRFLYTSDYDGIQPSAGKIQVFREDDYKLPHWGFAQIIADVWSTPKMIGWKSDKQKREFYKEAKQVGLISNKRVKNEWYKIFDIINKE